MNIIDIAKVVKWVDVKRALDYFYPEDKNNYESLFKKIQKFRKQKQKDKDEVIEIKTHDESFCDTKDFKRYYSVSTNRYSLSFRPWLKVSNIEISEDTINHYTLPEILAHFIWEITFYGDESSMKKRGKALLDSMKEAKKKLKKDRA